MADNQRAVVFDLDDTLYPEREFVQSGFQSVAQWASDRWKIPAGTVVTELTQCQTNYPGKAFHYWLAEHQLDDSHVEQMISIYRSHTPSITPFPGVATTIAHLRQKFKIGLISDGYLATQENKFRALGLEQLFDAIVFSDALGREHWKPHPKPYLEVLKRLGTRPVNTIYVADNPTKDFQGAARVGMQSIRFRHAEGVYAGISPKTLIQAATTEVTDWTRMTDAIQRVFSND